MRKYNLYTKTCSALYVFFSKNQHDWYRLTGTECYKYVKLKCCKHTVLWFRAAAAVVFVAGITIKYITWTSGHIIIMLKPFTWQ